MKKRLVILLCFITFLTFNFIHTVDASTNTYSRSEEDYLVDDWVSVTPSNKSNILNTPAVDASEKLYDFADLFSDSEEDYLYSQISSYIQTYKIELVIVTIDDNPKSSSEVYADDFYDYNYFSQDAGVLFLIDMDNREIYISTTGDAINMYNDYRINTALDSVYTYMSNSNYYQGVTSFISMFSNYARTGYPTTNEGGKNLNAYILLSVLISAVVTWIIMKILINKNQMVRISLTAKNNVNDEKTSIHNVGDVLVNTHTSRHLIQSDYSGSGGGSSSSGGSSTHTGSSGASHGGGGHKF